MLSAKAKATNPRSRKTFMLSVKLNRSLHSILYPRPAANPPIPICDEARSHVLPKKSHLLLLGATWRNEGPHHAQSIINRCWLGGYLNWIPNKNNNWVLWIYFHFIHIFTNCTLNMFKYHKDNHQNKLTMITLPGMFVFLYSMFLPSYRLHLSIMQTLSYHNQYVIKLTSHLCTPMVPYTTTGRVCKVVILSKLLHLCWALDHCSNVWTCWAHRMLQCMHILYK